MTTLVDTIDGVVITTKRWRGIVPNGNTFVTLKGEGEENDFGAIISWRTRDPELLTMIHTRLVSILGTRSCDEFRYVLNLNRDGAGLGDIMLRDILGEELFRLVRTIEPAN